MASTKYCNNCRQNVRPAKKFNWLVFIFLCGLFYIPYYLMKTPRCLNCNDSNFSPPQYR